MDEGTNPLMPAPVAVAVAVAAGGDLHRETNCERREKLNNLQKEAFQLANYYFVFQGVIFTGFYNTPSHLKCEYRWIPFTLSFLAGFLNLCALTVIAFKYKGILDDIDRNVTMADRPLHHSSASAPATRGPTTTSTARAPTGANSNMVRCVRNLRTFYVLGCLSLFIGFFVVTLIGCLVITCGKDTTPPPPPQPATMDVSGNFLKENPTSLILFSALFLVALILEL